MDPGRAGRRAVRVAAIGDLHVDGEVPTELHAADEEADLLLLAGDLTNGGEPDQARRLAAALAGLTVPVAAVLGNHDHHGNRPGEVRAALEDVGVHVLEGTACRVEVHGVAVGIAGAKGFAGGLAGSSATAFGEPEMKAFVEHGRREAEAFGEALGSLDTPVRLGLLHYSPVAATIVGERPEISPFLADHRLAVAADHHGADLVVHGHAHSGRERGATPGGIPVRNVARPVIRAPFRVYTLTVPELTPAATE